MRNCSLHLLLLLITLSLVACNPHREASDLLQQAQNLVDTQPDKALLLIDSIFYPERSLSKREYMSYLVTRVQARRWNSLPIDTDTFIFAARDYFTRHNHDPRQTALAFFYSGRVYLAQGNSENAMKHYEQAAQYAAQTNDANLQGLIQFNMGDLFVRAGLHLEALDRYKKAERLFAYSPSNSAEERRARCFAAIGQKYMLLGQEDNSFAAFYKGLKLAKRNKNSELLRVLNQNMSVSYLQTRDYKNAEKHLRQAFELNANTANLPRFYLNFAELFMNTNQTDSLNLYIDKLRQVIGQSDDLYFKKEAYHFLATNAIDSGDLASALHYQQRQNSIVTEIYERRLRQSVYEARQRFNYQKYQYAYIQALLVWQRLGISFLIFCFLASLFVIFIYRRMVHQKNRLLSMQNVIHTLKQTNENIQNQQSVNALLWKLDTLYKCLLVKSQLGKDVKISANAVVSQFCGAIFEKDNPNQWDILAEVIEEIHPGFQSFLKNRYSHFSDTEHKVAVLSFAGIRPKEIACILETATITINMARTKIRKKMNLTVQGADFCAILKQHYHSLKT